VTVRADALYEYSIRHLSRAERRRLLTLLTHGLALEEVDQTAERSLLELAGLGAAIWQTVDAQEYVDRLRDAWDRRA
jgi:hypothetical protein